MRLNNKEDKEFINKLIRLSQNISKLYEQLTDAEFKYGKSSDEYKTIVRNIDLSVELETELKQTLYNSPKLLIMIKNELPFKYDERNAEIFQVDPLAVASLYYAMKCEEYEKLQDFGKIMCSKESYLEKTYYPTERSILINGMLEMLEQKTYIRLLDEEINNTKGDEELKHLLISEKNKTIRNSPAIENWYFGLGTRNDAILVDDDEVISSYIDVDPEIYRRFKKQYFSKIVDGVEDLVLSEDIQTKNTLKIYKINLLGALLNLDLVSVNESYKEFFRHVYENQMNNQSEILSFIDEVYAEYPKYLKKISDER